MWPDGGWLASGTWPVCMSSSLRFGMGISSKSRSLVVGTSFKLKKLFKVLLVRRFESMGCCVEGLVGGFLRESLLFEAEV